MLASGDCFSVFYIYLKLVKNCSLSEVQRGQIVVLHKEDYTQRRISEQLGYSKTAMHQEIVKLKNQKVMLMQNKVSSPANNSQN